MNKSTFILLLLMLITPSLNTVSSEELGTQIHYQISPEPIHEQIRHQETYLFNVSIANLNLTVEEGQWVAPENHRLVYTGGIIVEMGLEWKGYGNYRSGGSSTGYSLNIDDIKFNQTVGPNEISDDVSVQFNYTFERDAYLLGLQPYERLEVTVKFNVYYETLLTQAGEEIILKGDSIIKTSETYFLLDDTKIDYVEGKYSDMIEELEPLEKLSDQVDFNATRYLYHIESMNKSIQNGDYFKALDISKHYDKVRTKLITNLLTQTNSSMVKAAKTDDYIKELEFLEINYKVMEDKYQALQRIYQDKLLELARAKNNLSTAITAVFLTAIIFFFLGRYSKKPRVTIQSMEIEPDTDVEPSLR